MVQPYQINMGVFFWHHVIQKVIYPVSADVHQYTGQVTFYKVPETHGHLVYGTEVSPFYFLKTPKFKEENKNCH